MTVIREGGRGRAHLYVNNDGAISDRAAFDAQVPVLPGFERLKDSYFNQGLGRSLAWRASAKAMLMKCLFASANRFGLDSAKSSPRQ